jgi:hypothetical protein
VSRFAPVFLPPERSLDNRASMTFLKHADLCPRSGYLYALHKGEVQTPEMVRGSAFHALAERSLRAAMDQGEAYVPPEVVKVILDEVLAEYPVPLSEHDYLREAAWRFGAEVAVDPSTVVALETLFHLDIAGWQVRCKVDLAESLEDGAVCAVTDWKTARALPPYEEIARKRPDGRLAAKSFQLVLYGLALAFGVPVRVEECGMCKGDGNLYELDEPGVFVAGEPGGLCAMALCPECEGRGRTEVPEPFPVASRAQTFNLSYVYPGIEDNEGRMARRSVTLTRLELEEYRASLESLMRRVERSEQTGDWPAQVSDEGCGICPCRQECPIPVELRDHRGTVNTPEEASEAAERLAWEKRDHAARQKELREFAKVHGPVPFGREMVMTFTTTPSERWDREGLVAASKRAAQYGEPFDPEDFVKRSESSRFAARALTAEEVDEKATVMEGSK